MPSRAASALLLGAAWLFSNPVPAAGGTGDLESQRTRLQNGLETVAVRRPGSERVGVFIGFKIPDTVVPAGKAGIRSLVIGTLAWGGPEDDGQAWRAQVEELGGSIEGGGSSIKASFPLGQADRGLGWLAGLVQRAQIDPASFVEAHGDLLVRLEAGSDNASDLARQHVEAMLAAGTASPELPDLITYANISLRDADSFLKSWIRPDLTVVGIAGDRDPGQLVAQLERHFGDWQREGPPPGPQPQPPAVDPRPRLQQIRMPGLAQTYVGAALELEAQGWPAYVGGILLSHALGGDETSRLFRRARATEQLSYAPAARLSYDFHRCRGSIAILLDVDPGRGGSALDAVIETVGGLGREGLRREELEAARGQFRQLDALDVETLAGLAAGYRMCGPADLGLVDALKQGESVPLEEIDALAAKTLRPSRLVVSMVAGDPPSEGMRADDGFSRESLHYLDSPNPSNRGAQRSFHRARALIESQNLERGAELLRAAVEKRPDAALLQLHLAQTLAEMDRTDEAEEAARQVLRLNADWIAAQLLMGQILLSREDPEGGLGHADVAIGLHPRSADAWTLRGQCLSALGKLDLATQAHREAVEIDAGNATLWVILGSAYNDHVEDYAAAIEAYARAAEVDPKDSTAWAGLGNALDNAGRHREALERFEEAVALQPDFAWAWRRMGDVYNDRLADYPAAIEAYSRAVEADPNDSTAWAYLGNSLRNAGRPQEAVENFEKAVEVQPDFAWAWRRLGDVHNDSLEDYPAAIEAYGHAVEADPDDSQAWAFLGDALGNAGRPQEAVEKLAKAVALQPDFAWAWRRLGTVYHEPLEDYPAAIEAYGHAVEADPNDGQAWAFLGDALDKAGRPQEALAKLAKAVSLQPDFAWAWRRMGDVHNDTLEDYPAAIQAYSRAVEADPNDTRAWAFLGDSLDNAGRPQEALAKLGEAVSLQPDFAWAWRRMGTVYNDTLGDYPAAIEAYSHAVEADPDDSTAWAYLGNSLRNAGRHPEAVEKLEKAVALQPDFAWAWRRLGTVYNDTLEDYPAAVEAYSRAVEVDPDDSTAWAHLGNSLDNAGRHQEALEKLEKAVSLQPDYAWAWRRLGDVRNDTLEDYRAAIEAYSRAVEADPDDSTAWAYLGNSLHNAGRHQEAVEKLEKAVALQPDFAWAWRRLGTVYNDAHEDYPAAVEAYSRAVEADPDDSTAWAHFGNSLHNAGRHREALEKLEKAVSLEPGFAWAWRRLGDVRNDTLEDYPAAIEAYSRAVEADPDDSTAWAHLGNSLHNAGRNPEAVEKLEKAVALQPDFAWAWRRLGEIYIQIEDPTGALRSYESAREADPDSPGLLNDLAWLIATEPKLRSQDRLRKALELSQRACELTGYTNAAMVDTLAEVQFQLGDARAAAETIEKAIALPDGPSEYLLGQRERFREALASQADPQDP